MTRLCTRCGHPLGGGTFRIDTANAGRAHVGCGGQERASRLDEIAGRLERFVEDREGPYHEDARNAVDDLAALLEFARAVEALHRPYADDDEFWRQHCGECDRAYPCPTAEALIRLEDR